jgi:recombination protein RecR
MVSIKEPIKTLVAELKRLPGVGEKTAQRYTYALLSMKADDAKKIAHAIVKVKDSIIMCSRCYDFSENNPCSICSDTRRDQTTICVIEDPRDLLAIEKSTAYRGVYHVLHGVISPISGIGPDELRIAELKNRIGKQRVKEVIIATNPTKEGEVTAHVICEHIDGLGVKITRIAQGVPMGGDIEYFDPATLLAAMKNRREL